MVEFIYCRNKKILSGFHFPTILLVVLMLMITAASSAQDEKDYIPDGTQGEMLEVVEGDSVPKKWRDKRWRLFPGRYSTIKFGGGFLYDFVTYAPDDNCLRQMDSLGVQLGPTFKTRDVRLVVSGQIKSKRSISWKAGFMYDGPSDTWFVRESGIMIGVPELSGHFFVGRTKEGFSMSKVMNGYSGWAMERQMAIDVIPILADGVKWLGFLPKQRLFWNIGIFTDWLSESQSFSTYRWQFAPRLGWLPVYSKEENQVLHVGISYRYGETKGGEIQLRSRPEANPAPYFISTGSFKSNHSNHLGYEIYYSTGSWMMGSELYTHRFNSPEESNPVFYGGEVMISYIFTGETRPYHTATGIYGFVPVRNSVFKGGMGALEAIVRFSSLDLDDEALTGGKFWRITPMLNWYLSKDIRLEIAYGYGVLDRFNLKGTTHFFQSRIQFALL